MSPGPIKTGRPGCHCGRATRLLPLPVFFVILLLIVAPVSAQPPGYDLQVESATFEPGDPVKFFVSSGPANMTFTIRVTDTNKDIVSGRDAQTNSTGKYVMSWIPTQSGNFDVGVVFSSGVSISRNFLVQVVVDEFDIAEIYRTFYDVRDRTNLEILKLSQRVDLMMSLMVVMAIVAASGTVYIRHLARSRANTTLEDLLTVYVEKIADKILTKKR